MQRRSRRGRAANEANVTCQQQLGRGLQRRSVQDGQELGQRRRSVDMQPRSVIFDLGVVLIDWNPRYLYRKLFNGDEQAMEHFLPNICSPAWNKQQDAGRTFWINRLSDNVGSVKLVLSVLRPALGEERHFALDEGCCSNQGLARDPCGSGTRSDPSISSVTHCDHTHSH